VTATGHASAAKPSYLEDATQAEVAARLASALGIASVELSAPMPVTGSGRPT
jgi:hypothetical protein